VSIDYFSAAFAWALFFYLRQVFIEQHAFHPDQNFLLGTFLLPLFWLGFYLLQGTYHDVRRLFRMKVLLMSLGATFFGTIVLFFTLLLDDQIQTYQSYYQLTTWLFAIHFTLLAFSRILFTTVLISYIRAAGHGFSWFARPSEPGFVEVCLRHAGGAEISADGTSISALLAGLLGHPLVLNTNALAAAQAAEPEQEGEGMSVEAPLPASLIDCGALMPDQSPEWIREALKQYFVDRPGIIVDTVDLVGHFHVEIVLNAAQDLVNAGWLTRTDGIYPKLKRSEADVEDVADAVEVAAESLAVATGGAVVLGPTEYIPDPDEAERARLAGPLTAEQRRACVDGIKLLTAEQKKSFTIAFRDAFKVSREEKAIAPLITQVRHMEFCDRFAIEAAGGVAA
jgi:hypothetical protein